MEDNVKINNPKNYKHTEVKINKLKRKLSKKFIKCRKVQSNRYFKLRKKIYKLSQSARNQKLDFLHKLSHKLVNENQVIIMESLDVSNMMKNPDYSKNIQNVSWTTFVNQMIYKCNNYGREFIQIDQFYPSSKICYHCKHKYDDLDITNRTWQCPHCHVVNDRDYNGSLNIRDEGLRIRDNRRNGGVSSVNNLTLVKST